MNEAPRFTKVLVANRGEIAVRVLRALRDMGLSGVAVASEVDENAPHARSADACVKIGGKTAAESYLAIDKLIDAAKTSGAGAIHPGYGFLSENAMFAEACAAAGVVFIGPRPDVIRAMGSKVAARQAMQKAGVPIVPGDTEPVTSAEAASVRAAAIGFPVAFKAASGGGGKGFRVATAKRACPTRSPARPPRESASSATARSMSSAICPIPARGDPDRRRRARQRRPPRGARLLGAASASKTDRGGACAGRGRGAARTDRDHGRGRRPRHRLHLGRAPSKGFWSTASTISSR